MLKNARGMLQNAHGTIPVNSTGNSRNPARKQRDAEFFENVDDRTRPAHSDDTSRIIYFGSRVREKVEIAKYTTLINSAIVAMLAAIEDGTVQALAEGAKAARTPSIAVSVVRTNPVF